MQVTIDHLGIVTDDVEASVSFYVELLGGEEVEAPRLGHRLVRSGALTLAIVPRTASDPLEYAHGSHLALRMPSTSREELLRRLDCLGAARQEVRGRIYTRDPGGFVLEFLFE